MTAIYNTPAPHPQDEFHYLSSLLVRSFDAPRFQEQAAAAGARPAWVDALIAQPRGRSLLYQLAAAHPGALVLEMALRRAIRRGYIDEVAEAGGSALAGMLPVFHRCGNAVSLR